VSDLIEQVLGTADRHDGGWWLTTNNAGRVDAHLVQSSSIPGVTFQLESSTDLKTWQPLNMAPTSTDLGQGAVQHTWSGITSLSGQSAERGIVRLRVTAGQGSSAVTSPQGWQRFSFESGTRTVGVSLVNAPVYAGRIADAHDASVVLEDGGQISLGAESAAYLEVLDGAQAGHRLEIAALTAGTAQVALDSPRGTLSTLPADLAGARVVVRPHVTLAQVFPTDVFQPGATATAADQVLFLEGGAWTTCWLNGSRQWVSASEAGGSSQNGKIIAPGVGVMVKTGSLTKSVTLPGHVRTHPWRAALAAGQNLLALPWPVDGTPASLGLTTANGFTASTSVATADQLQLWKGDTTAGATTYDGWWLLKRGTAIWTAKGSARLQDVSASLPLRAHRAFFLKVQAATAANGWVLP
jgi:hypothetical protein